MSSFETPSGSNPTITAEDAAAYWLIQRDKGEILEGNPQFLAWLAAASDHLRAWDEAVALWESFEDRSDPLLDAMRRDALSARRGHGAVLKLGAIAASIIIMLIGGSVGWRMYESRPDGHQAGPIVPLDARPTFVAKGPGPATFTLPDGSLVTLNANAALAVRYTAGRRAVRLLRGQGFFHIVHDPARPFTTDAGENVISDLGTEFDILMRDHALSVTLVSGSIAVATKEGGGASMSTPGQMLEIAPGQLDRIVTANLENVAAWRTAYIEFHDKPLEEALAQINQYGGAPARLADLSIRTIKVSGRFRTGDPARFARALAEIYPLRIISRPDGGVDIVKR
jgi:transmembrane sensor